MSDENNTDETKSNNEQDLDLVEKARIERERRNRFPGTEDWMIDHIERMHKLSTDHYLRGGNNASSEARRKDESYLDFMVRLSKKHYGIKD